MRLPLAKYDYILKEMNKLLKAAAIDFYRDEHIKNMLSNFDTVLTKNRVAVITAHPLGASRKKAFSTNVSN